LIILDNVADGKLQGLLYFVPNQLLQGNAATKGVPVKATDISFQSGEKLTDRHAVAQKVEGSVTLVQNQLDDHQ
jgi:hypothetical protein